MSNTATPVREDLRHIPLSSIVVKPGFNPRGEVADDAELAVLAETIKTRGVKQPLRVRAVEDGYELIDGERRYRAAAKVSLMEVPAIVEAPDAYNNDEADAERQVDAIIANDVRVDLDPVARATSYARLKADGLTIKGIAERIGRPGRPGQQHVRDHLAIAKLPEALRPAIADGQIPMNAVSALNKLADVHPELAQLAARRVLAPEGDYYLDEPLTWTDVVQRPLTVVSDEYAEYGGQLPAGIYPTRVPIALSVFSLTEKTRKDLAALARLLNRDTDAEMTFDFGTPEIDAARALNAAYADDAPGAPVLIVGDDVAAQLVADGVAASLKWQRQQARQRREAAAAAARSDGTKASADDRNTPQDKETPQQREKRLAAEEEQRAEQARAERERLAQEKIDSAAFNDRLGAEVYKHLVRVRVDDRVLKVLTALSIAEHFSALVMCGARYGMPGWVTEVETRGGKTKRVYLDSTEAQAKGREFLAGARTSGEIAGRTLALIVMAIFAKDTAVAQSSRVPFTLQPDALPWADDVNALIDELVIENLGEQLLADQLAQRAQGRPAANARRAAIAAATVKLDELLARVQDLDGDEFAELPALLSTAFSGGRSWMQRYEYSDRIAAERKRREGLAAAAALQLALDRVLAEIGQGLSLAELTADQLDELSVVAAQALEGDDLAAVAAAIDRQRAVLAEASNGSDEEVEQTS